VAGSSHSWSGSGPAAAAHAGRLSRVPRRVASTVLRGRQRRNALALPDALHHVRDVTMNEDAHRLCAGTAPAVMATFRNTATAAPRLIGFTNTAQGRRWAARDATRPLAALNLTI
jgi:hypothetical protein